MKSLFVRRNVFKGLLVLMVVAGLAAGWWGGSARVGMAQGAAPQELAPTPAVLAPNALTMTCTIKYIMATANSVLFQCVNAYPGTVIFTMALPTATGSSQAVNRMMAVITTAFSLGKPVDVYFTNDTSLNPPDCVASTCRRLDYVILYQ